MTKNLIHVLVVISLLLIAGNIHSQKPELTVRVKGRLLSIKQDTVLEASKQARAKQGPRKQLVGPSEISALAGDFGLAQWIDVAPSSRFAAYWSAQEPTQSRLVIELAGLAVILKAAKASGLNPEAEQIYSAPPAILAAVQKETADLEKVRLVDVPNLGSLSRAQAENELMENRLVPEAIPQYANAVNAGLVIPDSQEPAPKISVKPGTLVRFGVSVRSEAHPAPAEPTRAVTVSLELKGSEQVSCPRGGDNIHRCSIKGTSSGLSAGGYGLLLWVRPVRPASDTPGWYLQRLPANGISGVQKDGSWTGVAQLGNPSWPPNEGDTFDVAVSVADMETAKRLMAESGVVIRNEPVGVTFDTALGLVTTLK